MRDREQEGWSMPESLCGPGGAAISRRGRCRQVWYGTGLLLHLSPRRRTVVHDCKRRGGKVACSSVKTSWWERSSRVFSRGGRPASNQRGPSEEGLAKERVANGLMMDEGYGVWVSRRKPRRIKNRWVQEQKRRATCTTHRVEVPCTRACMKWWWECVTGRY